MPKKVTLDQTEENEIDTEETDESEPASAKGRPTRDTALILKRLKKVEEGQNSLSEQLDAFTSSLDDISKSLESGLKSILPGQKKPDQKKPDDKSKAPVESPSSIFDMELF